MGSQDREEKRFAALRRLLLEWYGEHRRDLPWRKTRDPYSIWISEIMLQQTRVAAVVGRFRAFIERFPTLVSLAQAPEDEVLALWSGLGYYRRARMLHRAAQAVASDYNETLPRTAETLRELPGIGAYTAAAIASIAHGEPVAVVDGNVERVLCRLEGWEGSAKSSSALRKQIEALAARLVDRGRPGDFNQSIMELGAMVCLPRNPQCAACPIAAHCRTRGEHKTAPRKPMHSMEIGHALAVREAGDGGRWEVLLARRPDELTVMPGLWELPALRSAAVLESDVFMKVRHAIMQVNYSVRIRRVQEGDLARLTAPRSVQRWVLFEEADALPLTGLARKILMKARILKVADGLAGQIAELAEKAVIPLRRG